MNNLKIIFVYEIYIMIIIQNLSTGGFYHINCRANNTKKYRRVCLFLQTTTLPGDNIFCATQD